MESSEYYCSNCGASSQPDKEVCFACGQSLKVTAELPELHDSTYTYLNQRYCVLEEIGKGGFSSVFKAEDSITNRVVAIKAIHLRGLREQEIIEATDAFNREVQMLTDLRHTHLPRVYDHFADAENWYVVMDFIQGITLEKYLEQTGSARLPMQEVFDIALVLCDVLAYLHACKPPVIFRDLKPSNVILTKDGTLFLIDFGIARRFKMGQLKDTLPFGSPGYAAPEQYGRAQTTPRADIYSLGVILHQMLTGQDPSNSAFHFLSIRQKNTAVPEELDQLVIGMVALDASKRPESVQHVKSKLRAIDYQQRMLRSLPITPHPLLPGFPSPALPPTQTSLYPVPGNFSAFGAPTYRTATSQPPMPAGFGAFGASAGSSSRQQLGVMGQRQIQQIQQLQQPLPAYRQQAPVYFQSPQWQAFGAPPFVVRKTNYQAVASLLVGLAALYLPFLIFSTVLVFTSSASRLLFMPLVLILPVLAIVLGHRGRKRGFMMGNALKGNQMAVGGLFLGYLTGAIYLIPVLVMVIYSLSSFFR